MAICSVIGLAALAACTPSLVHADESSDRSAERAERIAERRAGNATSRPDGGERGDGDRGMMKFGRRGSGEGWHDQDPPKPEEWDEIHAFMTENSPVRLDMYAKIETELGIDSRVTQNVRRRIAARYREMNQLKDRNVDLYDFALRQLKVEDQVMGLLSRIRSDGDTDSLTNELRARIQTFVDNSLGERAGRLARLKEFVAKEDAAIAHDRAKLQDLVGRQRERFEKEMEKMLDFADKLDGKSPATRPARG